MEQTSEFTGWAIVELMGHNKVGGFVTTKAFGSVVMFRVHAPAVEPVEQVLDKPTYVVAQRLPAGSKVRVSRPVFEKWVGVGSVYALNPCTEERACSLIPQQVEVIEVAAEPLSLAQAVEDGDEDSQQQDDSEDFV
jgi:hypothetical protein